MSNFCLYLAASIKIASSEREQGIGNRQQSFILMPTDYKLIILSWLLSLFVLVQDVSLTSDFCAIAPERSEELLTSLMMVGYGGLFINK